MNKNLKRIDVINMVIKFLKWNKEEGYPVSTIKRRKSHLRSFELKLYEQGWQDGLEQALIEWYFAVDNDAHEECYSYPNCDLEPTGCNLKYGIDAEMFGFK